MSRIPRAFLKTSTQAYYHIFSHLVNEIPPLRAFEKENFLKILRRLSQAFYVDVLAYAIMDNHFHLIIRTHVKDEIDSNEALERAFSLYPSSVVLQKPSEYWKEKLCDFSFFLKELKQRFAQWYNKIKERKGPVWRARFYSILIEDQKNLIAALAYVDLNPFKAGITYTLETYRWISYTDKKINKESCGFPLYKEVGISFERYESLLKSTIALRSKEKTGMEELKSNQLIWLIVKYRTDGIVLGTKQFVEEVLAGLRFRRKIKQEFLEYCFA